MLLGGCGWVEPISQQGRNYIALDGQVEMLRDPQGTLDVRTVAARAALQPVPPEFNLGYIPDTVWLRLRLDRMPPLPRVLLLQVDAPLADTVRLYLPRPDGSFRELRRGEDVSLREYPYLMRTPVFQLEAADGRYPELYLRLTERNAMTVALKLWEPQALLAQEGLAATQGSVFLGFVIALCLAGAFIWTRSGAGPVRWYVAYIASSAYTVYKTRGLVGPFLYVEMADGGDRVLGVVMALSVGIAVSFSVRLMRLQDYFPRSTRVYEVVVWSVVACACVGFLLGAFGTVMPWIQGMSLLSIPLLLLAAAYLTWRGNAMARLYLVAFSVLYLAFFRAFLINLGLLPNTPFMRGGAPLALGLTLHLLLLTFSFAQRFYTLEKERQDALALALTASQRAEASLEHKVRERTRELDEEIAQRQATELRLRQALTTEQRLREEQREFVTMLSHEFRTPLAIIHASGQMLRDTETTLQPANQRRIEKIQASVERMDGLIERFLDNEHLLSEEGVLQLTTFALAPLIAEALDAMEPARERVQVDLAGAPTLTSDRGLLRIALDNLLTNALKYSPAEAPVRMSARVEDASVVIAVADEGPGIPQDEQASVFNKFARGRDSGGTAGAGLGLYLVRRIAVRLGGTLTLHSAGAGATFRLRLPLTNAAAVE
ncbi:sensor histidine kinase [Pseudoxanthomonas winnipegensis]|uniref:sensor histidine kinase n=1 Tax=Pseudoxanthomonas winnipegensis TaxID=2480810 RepID=UPI00257904AE|nr:sensor histidine kinase [Pseudoxanthomonas winnipegensis]WJI17527.1 sensor histidine kinase [Pseudoxanthomonas winnipegensis]